FQSASITWTDRRTISAADGGAGAAERPNAEIAKSRKTGLDTAFHPTAGKQMNYQASIAWVRWAYERTFKLQARKLSQVAAAPMVVFIDVSNHAQVYVSRDRRSGPGARGRRFRACHRRCRAVGRPPRRRPLVAG